MGSSCNVRVEKKFFTSNNIAFQSGWFGSEIFAKGLRNSVGI